MPYFSEVSKTRLATCHNDLQRLFNEVIKHFDCKIIEGRRSEERQRQLVASGASKTLNSKHLTSPSNAVDVYPYPINLRDVSRFYYFAGQVMATARQMGIAMRWGGDWDGDTEVRDQSFNDLGHFELRKK